MIGLNAIQEPVWLSSIRSSAASKFSSMDLPKENEEPWRYTDLRMLKMPAIQLSNGQSNVKLEMENAISMADAIEAGLLDQKFFDVNPKDKIEAMNTASWHDGFFIKVPKMSEQSVKIHVSSNSSTKNIILLEPESSLTLYYDYTASGMSTDFTQIIAGESSSINLISARKSENAFNFSSIQCNLEKNASFKQFIAVSGNNLTRIVSDIALNGAGADADTTCLFLGRDKGHIDITTNAHHNVPETRSNIMSKGVLYGKSSSVYRGVINICKDAVKTSSYLSDITLKMGENAVANSIPSLKIDAADVQAGHKAAIGKIDEEQIYYMMSRGLAREEAENMIVDGFFMPLINKVPQDMREAVNAVVRR